MLGEGERKRFVFCLLSDTAVVLPPQEPSLGPRDHFSHSRTVVLSPEPQLQIPTCTCSADFTIWLLLECFGADYQHPNLQLLQCLIISKISTVSFTVFNDLTLVLHIWRKCTEMSKIEVRFLWLTRITWFCATDHLLKIACK